MIRRSPTLNHTSAQRRCHVNAALWGLGNGLTSTTLMFYLALDFGAQGLLVSLIVASPHLFGVLRLGTPWLLDRLHDRMRFTIVTFAVSNLLLLALPLLTLSGVLASSREVLPAIVLFWAGYHLLEYMGVVALWSYMRDLVAADYRGRFLGVRERSMLIGQVVGMLAAGLFSFYFRADDSSLAEATRSFTESMLSITLPGGRWVGLALPAMLGAVVMFISIIPLLGLPRIEASGAPTSDRDSILAPLRDRRFLSLLMFVVWFGLCNGLTQTAQALYPYRVLGMSALVLLSLRSGMVVGQSMVARATGAMIDRFGNRSVMIGSVLIVALGPLCYLLARVHVGFFVTAWVLWIAYVGLNLGLPNMTWKLSGRNDSASYLAVYLAVAGLAYALGTITGGALFDWLGERLAGADKVAASTWVDAYTLLFVGGWLMRTLGIVWLWQIEEPGVLVAEQAE